MLSGVFIGLSLGNHTLSYLAWTQPEDFILGGIVTATAALLFWRGYHKEPDKKRI